MRIFKRKSKGGSSIVVTTICLPDGFKPGQVRVVVEGHGGSGKDAEQP